MIGYARRVDGRGSGQQNASDEGNQARHHDVMVSEAEVVVKHPAGRATRPIRSAESRTWPGTRCRFELRRPPQSRCGRAAVTWPKEDSERDARRIIDAPSPTAITRGHCRIRTHLSGKSSRTACPAGPPGGIPGRCRRWWTWPRRLRKRPAKSSTCSCAPPASPSRTAMTPNRAPTRVASRPAVGGQPIPLRRQNPTIAPTECSGYVW